METPLRFTSIICIMFGTGLIMFYSTPFTMYPAIDRVAPAPHRKLQEEDPHTTMWSSRLFYALHQGVRNKHTTPVSEASKMRPLLVMLGGLNWDISWLPTADIVRTQHACSVRIPSLTRNVYRPMVGLVENKIILCDVDSGDEYSLSKYDCWSLNLQARDEWKPIPIPVIPLFLQVGAVYGGNFYLIGGISRPRDQAGKKTVQYFNTRAGKWEVGSDLPKPLYEGCAVGTHKGLAVIGEFEEEATTNVFILKDKSWYALPKSQHVHINPGCGLGKINGRWVIVVVSGRKVEYHTLDEGDPWHQLPDLNAEHNDTTSVGMDGEDLVVAGGVDSEARRNLNEIEVLRKSSHGLRWVDAPNSLSPGRSKHGTVQVPSYLLPECQH
jgi:hypothetical protein